MKHLFYFFLTACIPSLSYCQLSDADQIKQLNAEWLNAYTGHDSATLGRILADDFILVSPNGGKMTRQDNLNSIASTSESITANVDSADVRIFGNTGLIVVYASFVIKTGGKSYPGKNCYADLYVKRNNERKAVAAHVTLLSTK